MPALRLETILTVDNLNLAWQRVQSNHGCSGGDGITVEMFAAELFDKLRELSGRVRNGNYFPGPLRRHDILKDDGTSRRLAIPCVADRILQTAVARACGPVLDKTFNDGSFGYRPGRSVQMAVDRIGVLRREGFAWVVEADIDRAFDNVPHDPVLAALMRHLKDGDLVDLIALWLEHAGQECGTPGRGLPQGSPLSPLLFNLFLDGLDDSIEESGVAIVRFADDFLLLGRSQQDADLALQRAGKWLEDHGLRLNSDGSRVVSFERGFSFLGKLFVRSLVVTETDEDDPEIAEVMRELAQEDEQDEKAAKAGHDPGARVLYLNEPGRKLDVTNRSFVVKSAEGEELLRLSHGRVDRIELGPAVAVDDRVLRHALGTGTGLALVSGNGETLGQLSAPMAGSAALHMAQARVAGDEVLATDLARRFVEGRLRNQRARLQVLNRKTQNEEVTRSARDLGRILRKLPYADSVGTLRGHEGRAGAVYWPALGLLCDSEHKPFRRSRPAKTPLNAAINYLTAMLERDIRAAVLSAGLHPGFGVLHAVSDRHDAFVFDLMEGFRALLTEGLAVSLFNRGRLRQDMFTATDKTVRISSDGRRALILGYEAALDRAVKSRHSGRKRGLRHLMMEEARAVARHLRNPHDSDFAIQVQDY